MWAGWYGSSDGAAPGGGGGPGGSGGTAEAGIRWRERRALRQCFAHHTARNSPAPTDSTRPTPEIAVERMSKVDVSRTIDWSGLVTSNQGAFSFTEPCRECQGVGTVVDEKCPECRGTGGVTKTRTLNVRVPPGVSDGQKIRLAGRGEPGERGGPAGDLHLLVKVRPDAMFGRDGDDLTITVPISYQEAVLGTDLRVPTMDGSVTVRVAAGTPSGRTLRVRGKGVPRRDGGSGDLLVTLEVDVPTGLSPEARKALDEFVLHAPGPNRGTIDDAVRRNEFRGSHARPE